MNLFKTVLLVGSGGAAGSILRYLTGRVISRYWPISFPLSTFIVNITGSFLIGMLAGFALRYQYTDNIKLLLITGLCGGYTTFSAFTFENLNLLQSGNIKTALLYSTFSVVTGVAATWAGLCLVK
ncbi:hypothetical protein CHU92_08575 [Flavobacterium cyanobacteriorum]|uniref:Fluoride-specific ion channel FluC n=1 Tax=Flavobacterium cyanobacteriorum TaxID=2022802 RepID=A0A255Z719_9FLAO|nr:fluoride efflux transporter CrcB [Flavobacterium cyanobacteriorum]OYQ37236.1 hypothetical protein CHU92_08575 [Flavobacterium cyanobacteriorum]